MGDVLAELVHAIARRQGLAIFSNAPCDDLDVTRLLIFARDDHVVVRGHGYL